MAIARTDSEAIRPMFSVRFGHVPYSTVDRLWWGGRGVNGNDNIYLPCAIVTVAFPRGETLPVTVSRCVPVRLGTRRRGTWRTGEYLPLNDLQVKYFSNKSQFPVNDGSMTMPTDRLSSNVPSDAAFSWWDIKSRQTYCRTYVLWTKHVRISSENTKIYWNKTTETIGLL